MKSVHDMIRELNTLGYSVKPQQIQMPPDAAKPFLQRIAGKRQEHFCVLTLDTKLAPIRFHVVTKGLVNAALCHPREVFYPAIKDNAHQVIIGHNHPSGDTTPSVEDLEMTRQLVAAGKIMKIEIVDHIIVGDSASWQSLRETHESTFL